MYQIIKKIGEPWIVIREGRPVTVFHKLRYHIWTPRTEAEKEQGLAFSLIRFNDAGAEYTQKINVDIQSYTHRIVGTETSKVKIFTYVSEFGFVQVGFIQSLEVLIDDSIWPKDSVFSTRIECTQISVPPMQSALDQPNWDLQDLTLQHTKLQPSLYSRYDFAKGLTK
jgi:hypothetical protein